MQRERRSTEQQQACERQAPGAWGRRRGHKQTREGERKEKVPMRPVLADVRLSQESQHCARARHEPSDSTRLVVGRGRDDEPQ
jgi:hypothetical protein